MRRGAVPIAVLEGDGRCYDRDDGVVRVRPRVAVYEDALAIELCERSTIVETLAAVLGLPGPLDPGEGVALTTAARKAFPDLELSAVGQLLPQHASAVAADPSEAVPPVWYAQGRWAGRAWLARWGHRILELHHTVSLGQRYTTFASTIRPTLSTWLGVAGNAYEFIGQSHPAAT